MSPRLRRTTAIAGGAAVLAFGAYSVGSQAGDGVAQSRSGSAQGQNVALGGPPGAPGRPGGRGLGGPGLEDLADKLGVKEADLRAALEDIRRDQQPPSGDRRDRLAEGLAAKLGVDRAKVEAALEKLRPERPRDRHADLTAALAKELGVSQAKVRAAFDKVRPRRGGPGPGGREQFLSTLAKELGVSKAKLRAAFQKVGPKRPGGPGRGGPPGPDAAALAKELGVSEADVQKALEELRAEHEAEHEKRRNELAQALADRLGVDPSKVEDALPEGPPHDGGRGRP